MADEPAFDDGSCPPLLAQALASALPLAVAAAVAHSRLLVPVVRAPEGSLPMDDADACGTGDSMASVTFVGSDGRRALLAFSSLQALGAWDAGARPLAQPGREVATAVVTGGLDALIVDIASPHRIAITGSDLRIAAG